MADIEPMIRMDEIRKNILEGSFADEPHRFYLVYDELMDELIIKLVPPNKPTSVYFLNDELVVLVDLESFEVVGFQVPKFREGFLQKHKKLAEYWDSQNLNEQLGNYNVFDYEKKHRTKERFPNKTVFNLLQQGSERVASAICS